MSNKSDCGIFGCSLSGFVAVIDAASWVCDLNPTTHPKNFGGPKTPTLKYVGLMWDFWERRYTKWVVASNSMGGPGGFNARA